MRLLALDIDHTLTGNGHLITQANLEAVAWAKNLGVRVTLITGRRYAGSAARHADTLGITGPIGCHYGRRVVDHPSGTILTNHPLPVDAARHLARVALSRVGSIVSAFLDDELVFQKLPPALLTAGFAQFGEGDLQEMMAARPGAIMSLNVSGNPDAETGLGAKTGRADGAAASASARGKPEGPSVVDAIAGAAAEHYPDLVQLYFVPWADMEHGMVTAISAAADKGTALVEIARLAGIDPADTVAMGDSEADIPMLQAAGVGVAMPWSPDAVRRAADVVAEGEPEDAVARAIRSLAG